MHASPPPWRLLAALAALALLLHAALLAGVSVGSISARAAPPAHAMQVRTLPAAEPVAEPAAEAAVTPEPAVAPPPPPAPAAPAPKRTARATPAATAPAPPPEADSPPAPPPAAPMAAEAAAPVASAASTASAVIQAMPEAPPPRSAGADELPIYKTAIPPPLTLVYDLARGMLGGTGTLTWRPNGEHYEARLEGRVAGLNVLTQVSQGAFDEAGLAPVRFTDQRMGREVRAANFQREAGKITFSGPQTEFTLLVGAQDRLSWMIQLAAVVSAEPQRLAPGGKVALYVVGARADASMWVFQYAGEETVDTPRGPVRAAKFSREARGPYDTQADAWLDPAQHGLPVRARLGTGSDGDALDLVLRELHVP